MAKLLHISEAPIVLTERGEWMQEGQPLHPRVAKLFSHHIYYDDSAKAYAVRLHPKQPPTLIDVRDTALFVRRMVCVDDASQELERVELELSDGSQQNLDPTTLSQSSASVLYAWVPHQGFLLPVRFTPAQYHELALRMREQDGNHELVVGGVPYPIRTHTPTPRPLPA